MHILRRGIIVAPCLFSLPHTTINQVFSAVGSEEFSVRPVLYRNFPTHLQPPVLGTGLSRRVKQQPQRSSPCSEYDK